MMMPSLISPPIANRTTVDDEAVTADPATVNDEAVMTEAVTTIN